MMGGVGQGRVSGLVEQPSNRRLGAPSQVLFSIFIRPIYDLESLTTYADDNYLGSGNKSLTVAMMETKEKIERVTKWMTQSGLKINDKKLISVYSTDDHWKPGLW